MPASPRNRADPPAMVPLRPDQIAAIQAAQQVARLERLREDGALTSEEFEVQKARILATVSPG